ncbi:MAG: hypothetical protein MRY83_13900, partial [Flavobacteriales bacterium]|nr:hypothetical protein [Flavobacteriales bacterium]
MNSDFDIEDYFKSNLDGLNEAPSEKVWEGVSSKLWAGKVLAGIKVKILLSFCLIAGVAFIYSSIIERDVDSVLKPQDALQTNAYNDAKPAIQDQKPPTNKVSNDAVAAPVFNSQRDAEQQDSSNIWKKSQVSTVAQNKIHEPTASKSKAQKSSDFTYPNKNENVLQYEHEANNEPLDVDMLNDRLKEDQLQNQLNQSSPLNTKMLLASNTNVSGLNDLAMRLEKMKMILPFDKSSDLILKENKDSSGFKSQNQSKKWNIGLQIQYNWVLAKGLVANGTDPNARIAAGITFEKLVNTRRRLFAIGSVDYSQKFYRIDRSSVYGEQLPESIPLSEFYPTTYELGVSNNNLDASLGIKQY